MEKNILIQLIEQGLSLSQIGDKLGKSKTTTRHWVEKYGLKTKRIKSSSKICPKCKEDKPFDEFYNRRGRVGNSPYCKTCTGKQATDRTKTFKSLMIEYKGGQCICCGYSKYDGALEFHHLDPSQKDFNPSKMRFNTFDERVKKELDKCVLLCSNCHREVHGGIIVVPLGIEPR